MSRGHGIIEQTILAACVSGELKPLVYIAQQVDYDPAKLSVRQSFSRAARNLAWEKGLADLYDLSVPTVTGLSGPTNYRDITCVCRSGLEITDQMWTSLDLSWLSR
jgi:hypothetical protein